MGEKRPKLLDLFCCQGGAGMGYYLAGFDVVGVDIDPQPRYPFEFHRADALEYAAEHWREFDVIHASPPCQAWSEATLPQNRNRHPRLIEGSREMFRRVGVPYVIENVEGAADQLESPMMLCGTMFGLPIWRHRYFETSPIRIPPPGECNHNHRREIPITIIYDNGEKDRIITREPVLVSGGGDGKRACRKNHRPRENIHVKRWAMECGWMTGHGLTEAIPPAYTKWIGEHLMRLLVTRRTPQLT